MNNNIENLLIELTQKCNLNCKYCFYRDYGRVDNEITEEQMNNIISEYSNLKNIFLTGGECTLAKDFIKIIKKTSEIAKVTIFTNGILLADDEFFENVDKYISKYIITYDDFDCNYFCRDKINETEQAIRKISNLSPEKLLVKVCINRYNKEKLEDIIEYLLNMGVNKISLNFIHNIKNSKFNFELDKKELKQVFNILNCYKNFLDVNYYEELKNFLLFDDKSIVKNCKAGKSFLYYDCLGNLSYCPAYGVESKQCISKECISLFEMF